MNKLNKTRYIIPFKYNGDIRRLFNLQATKAYVKSALPGVDVFVIEQGPYQIDKDSFFIFNDKKFNKSWSLNVAVKKALLDGFENVILGDADFISGKNDLIYSIDRLSEFECVSPFFQKVTYLTETQSNEFILYQNYEKLNSFPEYKEKRANSIPLAAGIICFKISSYIKIGGYPEEFENWGGEDDVVSIRSVKCLKCASLNDSRSFHLYHDDPTKTADRDRVQKFLKHYKLTSEEILENAKTQWEHLGDVDLYKNKEK